MSKKIITNLDWLIDHYPSSIGFALTYGKSFGITKFHEARFCNDDFVSSKDGLLIYDENHTYPEKERLEFLKDHFCEECIFSKYCERANVTKSYQDFKDLGIEKDYYLVQLHEWPKAKMLKSLRYAHGVLVPKGRIVEVIVEEKTDLLTIKDDNKVPIEFFYIIRYKNDLYSVMKEDIEFKEEYIGVVI